MVGPRVPYYAQTAEFSCGAACLVMALHPLARVPVRRASEFELWREATMIGVPGIDKWGLTIPARRRDVPATVISSSVTTFARIKEMAKDLFTAEQLDIADFAQRENRRTANQEGTKWDRRAPRLDDIADALAAGAIPVLLVDLGKLGGDAVPHWVIATAITDETVVLHDPDPDGPGVRRVSRKKAWDALDVSNFNAKRTIVVLGPARARRRL